MSNREGTIIGFNAAAEQLFGYKKSEIVGQNVKSLMGDDIARKHDRWIDNYHRTGERRLIGIRRIVRGQHKDGNPLDVEISLGELNKEGQTTFIATFRQQKKVPTIAIILYRQSISVCEARRIYYVDLIISEIFFEKIRNSFAVFILNLRLCITFIADRRL
jgi:PAS domain S-box-containing protein